MNKEFVSYKTALALKELGFDEPCFAVYYDTKEFKTYTGVWVKFNSEFNGKGVMSAPLYQQAFRWFREKYGLDNWVYRPDEKLNIWGYNTTLHNNVAPFKTYEEAEQACLDKLIEICKNK